MRLHRFIINRSLVRGPLTVADAALRNQLENVLRLVSGERVVLCDGQGMESEAAIVGYRKTGTEFAVESPRRNPAEPSVGVVLYCAVLKRENFELAVQKAVECGATRIVPLLTARTVKTGVRTDRAMKIAKEAAEQSGRAVVPVVEEPMPLKAALAEAATLEANVILEPGGEPLVPAKLVPIAEKAPRRVGVFVGPEGGWDRDEVAAAREKGCIVASLGPRTLRAETAVVVATYLAAAVGDMH